jgi:hypothetical protein
MMLMVEIREVLTRKQKRQFVDFPTKLYKGNDFYVHPLRSDEFAIFDPDKNVSFDECEIVFYLAYRDNEVDGRICGIIQKVLQEVEPAFPVQQLRNTHMKTQKRVETVIIIIVKLKTTEIRLYILRVLS